MSDIQVNWHIHNLDYLTESEGYQDVVYKAEWSCMASGQKLNEDPCTATVCGFSSFELGTGDFIPYEDLTQNIVLGWVWDNMGTGNKASTELSVSGKVYDQINSNNGLPWLP